MFGYIFHPSVQCTGAMPSVAERAVSTAVMKAADLVEANYLQALGYRGPLRHVRRFCNYVDFATRLTVELYFYTKSVNVVDTSLCSTQYTVFGLLPGSQTGSRDPLPMEEYIEWVVTHLPHLRPQKDFYVAQGTRLLSALCSRSMPGGSYIVHRQKQATQATEHQQR